MKRSIHLFLSLSLMLWLSGIGCAFVCNSEAMPVTGDHSHAHHSLKIVSPEASTASMHHHGSCHHGAATPARTISKPDSTVNLVHSETPRERITLSLPEGMKHHCPLADSGSALSTTVRPGESANAVAITPAALVIADPNQFSLTRSAPSLLNNRGHTYLRCCVFLI